MKIKAAFHAFDGYLSEAMKCIEFGIFSETMYFVDQALGRLNALDGNDLKVKIRKLELEKTNGLNEWKQGNKDQAERIFKRIALMYATSAIMTIAIKDALTNMDRTHTSSSILANFRDVKVCFAAKTTSGFIWSIFIAK